MFDEFERSSGDPYPCFTDFALAGQGNSIFRNSPFKASFGVFHCEANLERHLEVANLAVVDLAARLYDLEPAQVSNGFVGAYYSGANGIFDAFLRGAS